MQTRPVIVIPIGDVAGIGPEIVAKALAQEELYRLCRPLAVGEGSCMERALDVTGSNLRLHVARDAQDALFTPGTLDLVDLRNIRAEETPFGQVQESAGRAAYAFIERAVQLLQAGQADALATTTINKQALRKASVPYIGHTEILGGLTGTKDPMTMFQVRGLRVFFLSRHLSLRQAIDYIDEERVFAYIVRVEKALRRLGQENPRIAMAALNPHGGENGLFGREEMEHIQPAVERARAQGIRVSDPIGADSVFHLALQGQFDGVISLYHDQGHIATKMVDFERTISVTIGLPFLRTSVDHGTAFDIAGSGKASEVSMVEAIRLAAAYAPLYGRQAEAL